jgi:hypothetical protein
MIPHFPNEYNVKLETAFRINGENSFVHEQWDSIKTVPFAKLNKRRMENKRTGTPGVLT